MVNCKHAIHTVISMNIQIGEIDHEKKNIHATYGWWRSCIAY